MVILEHYGEDAQRGTPKSVVCLIGGKPGGSAAPGRRRAVHDAELETAGTRQMPELSCNSPSSEYPLKIQARSALATPPASFSLAVFSANVMVTTKHFSIQTLLFGSSLLVFARFSL